ncbi:trehalose-phosphatase [Rathayibacter sp. AY1D1]|uniref:trehalose-phosphatase n=1 Tax=Rathayibacter sp. AY1D1 TaxID=2080542 RepID=UPI000CE7F6E6|nr:trehalose-phosphatase [Rathayibacter sp. AY1D1]PPI01053.1 trehalose-phosphatase [Rathayibacter sp. AY1D1]
MSEGVPERLAAALRELAATDRLLVALDFDGTLAPEVDDPARARALPEAREAVLRLLALPGTRVALVSGRALGSLEEVSQLPDEALLVGSHGIEIRLDPEEDAVRLDDDELEKVGVLEDVLKGIARGIDNVWIEDKPAGFALHTRLATERHSRVAHVVALSEARAEVQGVTIREGKNVLEFSVRSTTKGEAVQHLRRYTGATAVLYAGDDVTDEDAFAVLGSGDVGIKSGEGTTAASYQVRGPEQVAHALRLLADLRAE